MPGLRQDDPDVRITDRKDDVVVFYDLLELSKTSGTKCLQIRDALKVKQKQLQTQITKLLQQRARFILGKDIITKIATPEETAPVHQPTDLSDKAAESQYTRENFKEVFTVNPTDQQKAKAENEIREILPFEKTLRDYDYLIARMKLEEQRLSALVRKYEVQYKKLSDNVVQKNSEYNQYQLLLDEYNNLIDALIDLIDIIRMVPNSLSTTDTVTDFTKKLNQRTFQYNTKRKAVIEIATDFLLDAPSISAATVQELIAYLQFKIGENLTDLLATGVAKKDIVLKDLTQFKDNLIKEKLISIDKQTQILSDGEDVDNEKVKRLKQKINNHISTDALNNIIAKDFNPVFLSDKIKKLREVSDAKLKQFAEALRIADGDWTKLATNIQKDFNFFIKKMVTLDKNFVNAQSQLYGSYKKSLEQFWRDKIRKKYGGNIPFCDETQVVSGSTTSFVKKPDVVYVNGVAMDKRVIQAQKAKDQILADDPELRV
jgi:hypothetical protein